MAIKFRNSFFGFNKDDVHSFVMTAKENEYKSEKTIKELNDNVNSLNNEVSSLKAELESTKEIINEYKEKEESLNKLSESIGRLYLVAQSNANAIAKAAKENIEQTRLTVEMNINTADCAQNDFAEIERELNEKVATFNNEINELRERLSKTKELVLENNNTIASSEEKLDAMTASISVN